MKKDNPFTLTFGKQPGEYISRYENTDTIKSSSPVPSLQECGQKLNGGWSQGFHFD